MQRPTFTATAVMNARRNAEVGSLELNLIDAKGNTQNLVLDNVAASHVLAALLQKSTGDSALPEFHLNESIPLHSVGTFRIGDHAGLRMYVNPTAVVDFVFEGSFVGKLKDIVDKFAATPAAAGNPAA